MSFIGHVVLMVINAHSTPTATKLQSRINRASVRDDAGYGTDESGGSSVNNSLRIVPRRAIAEVL